MFIGCIFIFNHTFWNLVWYEFLQLVSHMCAFVQDVFVIVYINFVDISQRMATGVAETCRRHKVKQSRKKPGVAQRIPGGLGSQISWHSAHESGDVSLTHRPPLPACSWYSFSLGAESTPGPWYGRKEIYHWKIQLHHGELIPGPSD